MEAEDIERYLAELRTELKNRGLKKPVRILLMIFRQKPDECKGSMPVIVILCTAAMAIAIRKGQATGQTKLASQPSPPERDACFLSALKRAGLPQAGVL